MTDTVRVPMSRQEARLAAQSGVVAWLSGYQQEYRKPHDTLCDLIADAMLAASPQGEGSSADAQGWRDIATAPRDGTSILAICASAYSPVAGVTWWNGSWTHYSRPAEKWHGGVGKWFPTHWMPLPPPPSAHPAPIKPSADTGELRERVALEIRNWPFDISHIQGCLELADAILDLIQSERAG